MTTKPITFRAGEILLVAALLTGWPAAGRAETAAFPVTLKVELPGPGALPARPGVLGNNIEWVHGGDGMLEAGTLGFSKRMVRAAQRLAPPTLRYPGGSLSDVYHWRDGMGPLESRGSGYTLAPATPEGLPKQKILFGTQEFLELCEKTGSEPMITVNVISGTAQEAADWVRETNVKGLTSRGSGQKLPKVRLWEIGNEPYLQNSQMQPDKDITPADFVARINEFITAMKAVDPDIKVIVPFRNATWGGHPVTPYPDFNPVVFGQIRHTADYVAIHNGYAPAMLQYDDKVTDEQMYLATMAATRAVAADLELTQATLATYPGTAKAAMAVTEYSAFFSFANKPSDSYVSTLAGALYLADVLRVFATTPKVEIGNFWSLAGNWFFGSFDPEDKNGNPRPVYWTLFAYKQLLQGVLAPVAVSGPAFDSPAVGLVPAYQQTPTVAAIATLAGPVLRIVIINKDAAAPADLTITLPTDRAPAGKVSCLELSGPGYFAYANKVTVKSTPITVTGLPIKYQLPPHAFVLLEVPLP